MAYYISLFSPETYRAFSNSDRQISGYREHRKMIALHVKPGDILICYMTKLSRWVGILEVSSQYFIDNRPIFTEFNDPFVVRFHVSSKVWLTPEDGIPIKNDICRKHLSFTKTLPRSSLAWTNRVRGSLTKLSEEDGQYLEMLLTAQSNAPQSYPLTEADKRKLSPSTIHTEGGQIPVLVPDEESRTPIQSRTETEHIQIQAALARIGEAWASASGSLAENVKKFWEYGIQRGTIHF